MLSFDIHEVDEHAVAVDGTLPATDPVWQEGDPLPEPAVHAVGRLSRAGATRFYWSGRIEGEARLACRRCLTDVSVAVNEDVHLVFAPADDDEVEDADVYRIDPQSAVVDLRPAIREQWLLSVPAFAVCEEECRGICATCGADLNDGPCDCTPAEHDSRWDALRKLRSASE